MSDERGPRGYAQFLNELAAREISVTSAAPEVVVFHHKGVEVHTVADARDLYAQTLNQICEFKPTWTLVSEDITFVLLKAALEASPSRVVYMSHTPSALPFGPDCFFADPINTELLRQAAGVITVSSYLKEYIRRWGGVESVVIPFPVYGSGPFPCFGCFDRDCVTMVNPSAIKGISIFIELARRLPDVPFAAVPTWATTNADRAALEQLPNVQLMKPAEDVDEIFAQTRVLLVPSLWREAFGLTVVEAMLRGIPVLASNSGGLPEAKLGTDYVLPVRPIERYEERCDDRQLPVPVVPEQDIGPWLDALCSLLSDRALYERQSAAACEAALKFVSGLSVAPFEDFLIRLAAEPKVNHAKPPSEPNVQELQGKVPVNVADLTPGQRALLMLWLQKDIADQADQEFDSVQDETPPSRAEPRPPLVAIQPHGSKRPFFCVHPGSGEVYHYQRLARYLGSGQPFYGIQDSGLDRDRYPHVPLEEMAATYVEGLRVVQPKGPYLLGGYSFGGPVVFEMAQQLRKQGQEIALLAILDSGAPPRKKPTNVVDDAALLAVMGREIGVPISPDILRRLEPSEQLKYVLEQVRMAKEHPWLHDLDPSFVRRQLQLFRARIGVVESYGRRAQAYPGKIVFFRSSDIVPEFVEELQRDDVFYDPAWGWDELSTGPVEVHFIPGDHASMFREPNVQVLAEKLGRCFDEAQEANNREE
jgi:thioesterase domain-containing protein